jgi:hypothetical protein
MKIPFKLIPKAVLLVLLSALFAHTVHAQSYSINWYKVAGGGGASTGGVYAVNGTIGQHDASGPMTGGNFALTGGFWSLYAVQTPGAPLLVINRTATNTAMIFWTYPSTGFALQQNTNLGTTNWTGVPQTVTNDGTHNYIIVNPPTGNQFYRLFKP